MNGNLIDTNVIIKLLNGDKNTIEIFEKIDDVYISAISAGELYYGAEKSSRKDENIALFSEFLSEYIVAEIDEKISKCYGEIKACLVKRGINIPENDVWIAATAVSNDYVLFTYDEHFKSIENIKLGI